MQGIKQSKTKTALWFSYFEFQKISQTTDALLIENNSTSLWLSQTSSW